MNKIKILFIAGAVAAFVSIGASPTIAAAPRKALSDINRDGVISQLDINMLSPIFGSINPVGKNALSDINQDTVINILDLVLVSGKIGMTVSRCEMADINNDGTVTTADLDIIGAYFGQDDNSTNMMADLNGDGTINILDLTRAAGLAGCKWSSTTRRPPPVSPI
jgi:hypothetical protein